MRRGSGEVQFALHAAASAALMDAQPCAREECHVMRAPPCIGRPLRGMGLVGIKCALHVLLLCVIPQMGCMEMQLYAWAEERAHGSCAHVCMQCLS